MILVCAKVQLQDYLPPYHSTSGNPVMILVSKYKIPAKALALPTMIQFTSYIVADTPIVETAVCATVLMALIPAAFHHFLFMLFHPF